MADPAASERESIPEHKIYESGTYEVYPAPVRLRAASSMLQQVLDQASAVHSCAAAIEALVSASVPPTAATNYGAYYKDPTILTPIICCVLAESRVDPQL
jgi:hypothetical protein